MKLSFKIDHLIPTPLSEQNLSASEVWNADTFLIDSPKSYLISAQSGKGKTTFLSILNGTRTDYTGKIFLDGKSLGELKPQDWAYLRREKISFVSQTLSLFPHLSALENIQLKNQLTNFFTETQILEIAENLGVEQLLNKTVNMLSLGQKQRIAIIRSLCQPFELLLLDEPFSNLDQENIQKVSQIITKHCQQQNAGLVLASLGDHYLFNYNTKLNL